jgi:hypothetical protein
VFLSKIPKKNFAKILPAGSTQIFSDFQEKSEDRKCSQFLEKKLLGTQIFSSQ